MHSHVLNPNTKGVVLSHSPRRPYTHRYFFKKDFHVSPFMDLSHTYDFSFNSPQNKLQQNEHWFSATLRFGERWRLGWFSLIYLLRLYLFWTLCVQILIHFEAVRLWRKEVPFYPHPEGAESCASVAIGCIPNTRYIIIIIINFSMVMVGSNYRK